MKPRLIILVVAAAALTLYMATRTAAPPPNEADDDTALKGDELANIRLLQTLLELRPLEGQEPPEMADLSIQVEVDPTGEKNRLYYYITEAHGYYVETFKITFYFKPDPDTPIEDSPLRVSTYLDDYLKAKDTLRSCTEIVPGELGRVGGVMGTSEQWGAEITEYGRARMHNPDPLPPLTEVGKCR